MYGIKHIEVSIYMKVVIIIVDGIISYDAAASCPPVFSIKLA